jgi:hypothetical protein
VRSFELQEHPDDDPHAVFGSLVGLVDGLIAPDDVVDIAEQLPPGSHALVVLFEHLWLRELKAAVEAGGGTLRLDEHIPADIVDAVEEAAIRAM